MTRGNCVGMIAQADLALNDKAANDSEIGRVVERISEPGGPAGAGTAAIVP